MRLFLKQTLHTHTHTHTPFKIHEEYFNSSKLLNLANKEENVEKLVYLKTVYRRLAGIVNNYEG
jgi:hypothetical protein